MIQKIAITNYKSVVNLELDLGRINVFIGENGCGKTNILEAIAMGSAAAANKLDNEFLFTRGVRVTEPKLMLSAFEKDKQSKIFISFFKEDKYVFGTEISYKDSDWVVGIKIYKTDNNIISSINELKKTLSDEQNSQISQNEKRRQNRTERRIMEHRRIIFDKYFNFPLPIYCPENYFLRNFNDEGQIRPLGIRGEGLFKHILDLYKQKPEILEKISENLKLIDWFGGFEIPKDLFFTEKRINIKDRFLAHLDYFDQKSANEGFLYLLFYFTLFISEFTPKFFSIDNIDNALNPKLCAKLIQVLAGLTKEHDKQVILTTHNPAILDGLDLTDDQQRLFTIYRNADGHTVARRIFAPKKVNNRETVRLSEAYIRGYLGGLPENF